MYCIIILYFIEILMSIKLISGETKNADAYNCFFIHRVKNL
jgi:hypothetical protein